MIGERELRLKLFGTTVRILVGGLPSGAHPVLAASGAAAILGRHQRALTRFEPDSELSRLNGDPAPVRVVSELTAGAVRAGLSAAQRSGGLVDPTLLGALEAAGYARSRTGAEPASLRDALRSAPERRPAGAASRPAWREVSVHGHEVRRPPGVRLDLGGTAKGLAADRAAALLAGHDTFAIDAGGDLVLGGRSGAPRTVAVADPLDAARVARFELAAGAVATSGIGTRVWRTETGFAHHLLDPATGLPAWTGVIQATAIGGDCLEAELLAKTALLSGPARGAELLERNGGVLVLDDGEIVLAGALRERTPAAA